MAHVFAMAGSLRALSYNRRLLGFVVGELKARGHEVDVYDLRQEPLPFYDGDVEAAGFPEAALALKRRILAAQGVVFATPEYNHNLPAVLKNAIDWASRPMPPVDGKPNPLARPFRGKVAWVMGATTGRGAVIQAQAALRQVLSAIGAWVVPGVYGVAMAAETMNEAGALVVPMLRENFEQGLASFAGEL